MPRFQINIKYLTQSRHLQPTESFSLAAYKKHAVITHVDFFILTFLPLPHVPATNSKGFLMHGLIHIKM